MTEVILTIVIIAILAYQVYMADQWGKERKQLINAFLAKTPEQLRDLDLADKVIIKTQPVQQQNPDLTPIENLSEEDFDEHIKEQLEQGI